MPKKVEPKSKHYEMIGLPLELNVSHIWWEKVMILLMSNADIINMNKDIQLEKCKDAVLKIFDTSLHDEAMIFLETFLLYDPENPSIESVLQKFREEMERRLEGPHSYDQLKYLVEAKNRIVRKQVLMSIKENNGFFDPESIIDFEDRCKSCKGTGELYRFSKSKKKTSCKACKDEETGKSLGYIFEKCPKCNGKKKIYEDPELQENLIDCPRCFDNQKNKSTGVIKVTCRACLGSKIYSKFYLDEMESTTRCHSCQGNGWRVPKKKLLPAAPFNSVLSPDDAENIVVTSPQETRTHLGEKIKEADVTE